MQEESKLALTKRIANSSHSHWFGLPSALEPDSKELRGVKLNSAGRLRRPGDPMWLREAVCCVANWRATHFQHQASPIRRESQQQGRARPQWGCIRSVERRHVELERLCGARLNRTPD